MRLILLIAFIGLTYLNLFAQSSHQRSIYAQVIIDEFLPDQEKIENLPDSILNPLGKTVFIVKEKSIINRFINLESYKKIKKKTFENLSEETYNNYILSNTKSSNIQPIEIVHSEFIYLDSDSLKKLGNWEKLKTNQNIFAIIEFSSVGYNTEKNQALLYFGYQAGPLIGGGFLLLYQLIDDKWVLVKKKMIWAS